MKISRIVLFGAATVLSAICITLFYVHKPKPWVAVNSIKTIDSFAQAADVLKIADKNTLVLFDVREVLYVPSSAVFHVKVIADNSEWLKQVWKTTFENAEKPEGYYMSIWKQQEIPLLIEPSIVQTIEDLQNRGVKVMVLTALMSGSDFTIPSLPEWRYTALKKLGLDFTMAGFPDMVFSELPAKKEQHPVLYQGILAASGSPKGQVLGAFLDRVGWKPDQVIFFDDNRERVESVADEMRKRGIPFYGFQYNGAQFVPGELDKKVAEFQLNYLVEHEKWLSEDEARKMLKQETQISYAH